MKRLVLHGAAGVALLGVGAIVVVACSHDNSSIFVQDVLAPQLVTNGMQCIYTAQTTQPVLSSGVLDLDFLHEYTPVFLVGNQLVPQVNSQQLQTETSTVNVQGAVVRITDAEGSLLNTFTRLTASTIYPSSGGVPGYAPIGVTIVDEGTILNDPEIQSTVLSQPFLSSGTVRLITYVQFFGQTLGGTNVETGQFEFPVDVCKGCLISFGATDVRQGCNLPNCLNAGSSVSTVSSPCVLGQDIPVDCSLCLGIADCRGVAQTRPVCAGDGG